MLILNTFSVQKATLVCLVLLVLSILNWLGEIKKWQVLVGSISFFEASKETLIAHSLSLFTPNKIGEYGGKILFYAKTKRTEIVGLTSLGHLSQLFATLVFGSFGLLLLFSQIDVMTMFSIKWTWAFLIIPLIFLVKPIRIQIKKIINVLNNVKTGKKFQVISLSFFRYLIFSHQFCFLLWFFEINISYMQGFGAISIVYVVASVIPVFALADAILKGSVALTIFSFIGFAEPSILVIVFFMWMSNVMLPAFLGYVWMLKWQPKLLMSKS
jgi:hypothetical protein